MFACFGRSSKKGKDALKSDTTDVPRKSEKGQGVACPPWPSGQLVHLQHWEDAACSGLQAAVVRVAVGGPLVACAKAPGESTLTPARYARLLSEFADTDDLFRAALESFHNLQKKGASAHLRAMTLEMATPPSWKAAIRFSNGGTSDRIRMHYTSVRTSGSAVAPALHIEHLPASQTVASMQPVVPDSDLVPRVPNFNFSASERGTVLSGKELMTPTRWRRAQIMQAEVPVLLTLFSQDGCVLEQNYNSIMYFGSIAGQYMWKETLGSRGSDHGRPGTLEQLFEHAPEAFEEVIEHLMYPENGPWKGTVQVKVQGLDRVSRANSAHPASARCSLPSVRTTPLNMARSSTGTGKEGLHLQLPSEDACAATEQGRGFAAEDTARNESWDTASSRPGSHGAVSVASGSYKTLAPPCSSAQAPCVPPSRSLNPRLSKSCSYMRQAETVALQHPDSQVSSHTSCTLPMAPMSLGNMGRNCSQDSREAETIRPASTGALGPPPMPLEQRLHRNSSMGPASGTRSNQNSRLASQLAAKMMHHSFHERVHLSYQAPAEQPLVPRRPSEALSSTASHLPSTTSGLRHSPLGTAETETPDYFSMSHVHQSVARLERQATGVSSLAGGSYNSSQHGRQHCSSRHLSISQEQPCVVRSESQATVTPWTLGGVSNSSSQGDRRHSDARPPAAADLLGWSAQTSQGQHAKGAVNKCVPEQLLQQQQQQQQQQASCHLLELPKRRHSESFPMRPHSELQLQQQQQQQHRLSQQVRVISGPGSVDRHPRVRFSGPGTTLEPEDGGESKQRISRPRSTSCLGGPPAGSPIFQEVAGQGGMGPATGGPFFQEVVGLHEMKSEQLVQQHAHVPGSQSTPISLEVADQHEIKSEQAAQQHAHVPGSPGSPIFQRVGSLHEISSAQLAQHTHVHGGSQGAPTSLQTPQRQSPCNESAKGQAMQPEQQQQQQQHEQEGERAQSRDLEGSMEEGHSTISGKQEQSLNGSSFSRARSRRRSHSNLLNQLDIDPPAQEKSVMYQEVEIKLVTDPETDRPAFLLLQRDVSEQVELENLLSELTEDQLAMLSQIFPRHVIHALSTDGAVTLDNIADLTCSHADVTILFLDIVSFTSTCGKGSVSPESVITFLNILFSRFDKLVQKYQVQKIDTIGDAYLVASGILAPDEDGFWAVDEFHDAALGAGRMMSLAVDMMRAALEVRMPDDQPVKLRIGLHTGPCVSGLVGLDVPKWSVFGDTVNTAARLEQTALPTTIQISNATKSLLPSLDLKLVHNGAVAMKGKGTMETWLWHSPPEWVRAWEGDEVPPLPSGIVELHRLCSPDPGSELGPTEGEDEEEYFQDFQEDVPRAQKETQDSFNFSNAGILLPSQGAPNSPKPIVIAPANGIADASIIHGEMEAVVVEEGVMLGTVSHEECQIGKNSSDVLTTSHAEHKAECLINRSQPLTHIGGLLVHGHTSAPMSSISVPTSNNGDSDIVRGILQQQDVVSEQRRCSKEEQRRPGFAVVGNLRNRDEMQEGGGKDEGAEHAEELSGDRLVTLPYWVRDSQPTLSPISSVSSGMVRAASLYTA
ncbi:hypothetical protein DUNSADRAFT_1865 [Dunaliella salina]|uniref:Guanylate cyclase domain-containing protein n=1 Tax=Dunaliella salina TaxID=3046 RepID=A0ABZ3KCG8_DUNSA|nr:hypothetical protein DUNSADRAFT_1865 [Dunaliella salina]|eukprot:KAF5826866.1 hypothetical protein DUNSADRAFT_1865 [Dunaliella salina]